MPNLGLAGGYGLGGAARAVKEIRDEKLEEEKFQQELIAKAIQQALAKRIQDEVEQENRRQQERFTTSSNIDQQNLMLRANASGRLQDLLIGILKDPAMLVFLDRT